MEMNEAQVYVNKILHSSSNDKENTLSYLKQLRNLCARGHVYQQTIADNLAFNAMLQQFIFQPQAKAHNRELHFMALQVMANCVVGNETTQRLIWSQHGAEIAAQASEPPLDKSNDILLMIMYNIFTSQNGLISDEVALSSCLKVWQTLTDEKCELPLEYLHFFFEHFLVHNDRATVRCYKKLAIDERIAWLSYMVSYLCNESPNGQVSVFILQQVAKDFKLKSDCVLRQAAQQSQPLHPREVHTLLRIIAHVSGSEMYDSIYSADHSLFLNVGSLLRCLVDAGKLPDGGGLPKPMTKLEEVALTSTMPCNYESDVSFELKTLLVRCAANLLYKNHVNKQYCLDIQLMPALLECTVMDARNPLIREWSILAIRNACIDCPEIQQVIANLTMQGTAPNDLLNELNLEMGALRIKSDKA